MRPIPRTSLPERVASHLREGIQLGRWSDQFPGVQQLAAELDVARHTVRRALQLLEDEGVLAGRGLGRSRSITAAGAVTAFQRPLRVAILRHDARLVDDPQSSIPLIQIMHALEAAGHTAFFCKKSQIELKHDVARISRQLEAARADAWVVESGSRPLLEWCAGQPTPCLALYGRATNQPLASVGVNSELAYRAATRRLLALGHRRIVLIVREPVRKPTPGLCARAFLEELSLHGIQPSGYNLPDWKESPEGFNRLLGNLFKGTPPTALIIDETSRVFAALAFLARHGIKVPEHVSLIFSDNDAMLDWCHPAIARMQWDSTPIARNVVHWVSTVRKGNPGRKVNDVTAEFVPGGSIGPVWNGGSRTSP
jgi:DNA-binding LacI/PurR family transcriptional regulator